MYVHFTKTQTDPFRGKKILQIHKKEKNCPAEHWEEEKNIFLEKRIRADQKSHTTQPSPPPPPAQKLNGRSLNWVVTSTRTQRVECYIYSLGHLKSEYYLVSIHSFISTKLARLESLTIKHQIKQDLLHNPHRKFSNRKNYFDLSAIFDQQLL